MHFRHPKWIGAWWLGYITFGIASIVFAVPLFCFPRRVKAKVDNGGSSGDRKSRTKTLTELIKGKVNFQHQSQAQGSEATKKMSAKPKDREGAKQVRMRVQSTKTEARLCGGILLVVSYYLYQYDMQSNLQNHHQLECQKKVRWYKGLRLASC